MPQLHKHKTDSGLNRGEKTTSRTDNSSNENFNVAVLMHLPFHLLGLHSGKSKINFKLTSCIIIKPVYYAQITNNTICMFSQCW
jgi:hypothetical protein